MYHDFFSLPPLLQLSVSASTFSWSVGLLRGASQVLVPELCHKLHTVSSTNTDTLNSIQSFRSCNPRSRATHREPEPSTEPLLLWASSNMSASWVIQGYELKQYFQVIYQLFPEHENFYETLCFLHHPVRQKIQSSVLQFGRYGTAHPRPPDPKIFTDVSSSQYLLFSGGDVSY